MAKKEVYAAVLAAQESKLQEFTVDLKSEFVRKNCFRIPRPLAREGSCMKNEVGNVVPDADGMKIYGGSIWKSY